MEDNMKRRDVISWDDYFMGMAHLSAMRSKDPSTQVGACIVTPSKKVVGLGYNGFPTGISDDDFPWEKHEEYDQSKYAYVVHAELNAILNATSRLDGCTMYVSLFPCNECAKAIIQSGIKTLVYESDKYALTPSVIASKRMLSQAGVSLIPLDHQVSLSLSITQKNDE
jgi:dCMP deaminase